MRKKHYLRRTNGRERGREIRVGILGQRERERERKTERSINVF